MDCNKIYEALEKQLQLLSECSQKCDSVEDIVALSDAMTNLAETMLRPF